MTKPTRSRQSRPSGTLFRSLASAAIGCLAMLLLNCSGEPSDPTAVSTQTAPSISDFDFLSGHNVYEPQFAATGDQVVLVWRESGGEGSNLFLANRAANGSFEPAVRVNDLVDSVATIDFDEIRATIGTSGNLIGIAWSGADSDIHSAISRDAGATFEASVTLNSDPGSGAYRGFVGADVDRHGVIHAAWIDGRFAPQGAEEPAELMYARAEDGHVTEINLTADQDDSICGCCRVNLDVQDDSVVIAFRNTEGPYRDVFRVIGDLDGNFSAPARLGPPMWKLDGCPTFGPAQVETTTLWGEASTGKRRLLTADGTDGGFEVLLEDDPVWAMVRPPRYVAGASHPMLLVPGKPTDKLLVNDNADGEGWRLVADDLPRWATSGALQNGVLTLVGAVQGTLMVDQRDFTDPVPTL